MKCVPSLRVEIRLDRTAYVLNWHLKGRHIKAIIGGFPLSVKKNRTEHIMYSNCDSNLQKHMKYVSSLLFFFMNGPLRYQASTLSQTNSF